VITREAFKKFMSARLDYRDPEEDLKQAFDFYDQDGRGKITLNDLKRVAEEFGENVDDC
jgi:centrin-3